MSIIIDKNKILKIFFENPAEEFHVRELAKLLKIAPTTATKYADLLTRQKILEKRREINLILYRANMESNSYRINKTFYNINKIIGSGLVSFIEEKFNHPEAISLFGSYAKGENTKKSDIDLFILSESKRELNLTEFEKTLKCRIQFFTFNRKSFEEMKEKNKELLNNILNGHVLYGFLEVFQ